MKIGVFDSGIGGLTVLKEIIKKYPHNEYIYFGDTANLPYGNKSKEELNKFFNRIISFFEEKKVDIIIAACGTVSTTLKKELDEKGIIDVITPTINYVNNNYNKVGLIATDATIKSNYFQNHIKVELKFLNTPLLVPMIESSIIDLKVINDYMKYFSDIEVLILGCTHYPLIEEYIDFKVINMGTILTNSINFTNDSTYSLKLYFSKMSDSLIKNVNQILECDYEMEEYNA